MTSGRLFFVLLLSNALCLLLAQSLLQGDAVPARKTEILSLVALLLVVVDVGVWLLNRRWLLRARRLSGAMERLARGELDIRPDPSRSRLAGGGDDTNLLRSLSLLRDRLARQTAAIDRHRRSFTSLVNQLREGVIVSASDGRLVLVNPEAVRMLSLCSPRPDGSFEGLAIERCIPQHDLQELLRPPSKETLDATQAALSRGEHASASSQLQETRIHLDGPQGTVTLLARACDVTLPDETFDGGDSAWDTAHESTMDDTRVLSFRESHPPRIRLSSDANSSPGAGRLMVVTDITELARTIQVKTDFAANASHELRTPLASILAAAETLRSVLGDSKPASGPATASGPVPAGVPVSAGGAAPTSGPALSSVEPLLSVIERHGRRMQDLVADLLSLSKLESPAAPFEPTTLRPRDLLSELGLMFHDELAARNQHWTTEVIGSCGEVTAHGELLRVVLRNLVENAIRFTPPGGRIGVKVGRINGTVEFVVEDNGSGIPLEDQERVFERFYQVGRARSGPDRGTGLGLSIVRHAVAAMNGRIHLQSAPGSGTTVTITLPQPEPVSVAPTSNR